MAQGDWVKEHIRRYQESDGADGHRWSGRSGDMDLPCLLLTTTGAKSGEARITPLIYGEDQGRYIIIASRGGTPGHPSWYLNLRQNPDVHLQVAADKFQATARTATADERSALWQMMAALFPPYTDYQEAAQASREIPVVILERK